jgi:signal transduction histidine kinase
MDMMRMSDRFEGVIAPNREDPIEGRRQWFLHLMLVTLWFIAIGMLILLLLVDLLGIDSGTDPLGPIYLGLLSYLILGPLLIVVSKRVSMELAGMAFLIYLTMAISLADRPEEVVDGRTLFMFAIPILAASFIIRSWASFIFAGIASAVVVILGHQMPGYMINPFIIMGFIFLAILAWAITSTLEKTNRDLREMKESLELALRGAKEIIWEWMPSDRSIKVISKEPEWWGLDSERMDLTPEEMMKFMDRVDAEDFIKAIRHRVERGDRHFELEMTFRSGNGDWREVLITGGVVQNGNKSVKAVGTMLDVTARKRAEDMKRLYQSMIVNDIGSKLHIVHGYLDLPITGDSDDEDNNRARVMETLNSAERMIVLADQLWGMEKEPQGSVEPYFLLKNIASTMIPMAEEVGMEIEVSLRERGPAIRSDSRGGILLETVFNGVIENALIHSEGTRLRITSTETDENVLISFEDDGVGIDDELQREILHSNGGGKEEGKGNGIRIYREILSHLGGGLRINESSLGGARIDLELVRKTDL